MSELVSRSPQQPDEVVARAAATKPSDVAAAARRALTAGRDWFAQPAPARAGTLVRAAEAIADAAGELEELAIREVGKPRLEARGEVARAVAIVRYAAQQVLDPVGETYGPSGAGLLYTERRPHGVAGLITPWNFPLAIPLWKAAPALAAGNAVLLKPSTDALACALRLEELLAPVLPEGLLTVLPGEAETGAALVECADVVSFTGSTAVGRQVALAAAQAAVPVQAEMGGQNAAIVLPSADVERTARMLLGAATGYAGQKCTATRRIVVVGDPRPLTDALETALASVSPGDPAAETTTVGPLISATAAAAVERAVEEAWAAGARVLRAPGGARGDGAGDAWAAPALVTGLDPGHRLLQEETFGPLAAIVPATDAAQAAEIANAVRYGLVASVHGQDVDEALDLVGRLDCGLVKVNAPTTGVDYHLPFGGAKDSSVGPREQGKAGIAFYSSTRTVTFAPGKA